MGLVEAWGSGIKRILNAAEEYGLPKPKFQEFDNMFRVELFRVNPITDQANQATNQANQDLERLDQVEDENVLSEKENRNSESCTYANLQSRRKKWLMR